ncbi:MAG: RDD family protein [Acidimicrobiia bacterium]
MPADLTTRFLARLIDHLILGVVSALIIIPLIIGAMFAGNVGFGSSMGLGFRFSTGSLVASIVTALIVIGYFTLMEARNGQTLGKMIMSIRTQGPGGTTPTTEQAFKRNAWYAIAIIPFLGGLLQLAAAIYIAVTINNSVSRIGWHDTFAGGTQVVKTK